MMQEYSQNVSPDVAMTQASNDVPADTPKSWVGARSETDFMSDLEDGVWLLKMRIDAEVPVVIQSPYPDHETMQHHAEIFDYALSVAQGTSQLDEGKANQQAMALFYVRDFYRSTSENLSDDIEKHRETLNATPENAANLRRGEKSAETLERIAVRIESELKEHLAPEVFNSINQPMQSTSSH